MKDSNKTTEKIENQDEKLEISITILHAIFFECISKINYWENGKAKRGWAAKLVPLLELSKTEATNQDGYEGYLRDRFKWCRDYIQEGNLNATINIFEAKLAPLLKFINKAIGDINPGDTLFNRVDIAVLFTAEPYGLADIFRNPDNGVLSFDNDGTCEYRGEEIPLLKIGKITGIKIQHMSWEHGDNWLEVDFIEKDVVYRVYMAEYLKKDGGFVPQPPASLLTKLQKQKKAR